jgi:glycerol uptake facilitator
VNKDNRESQHRHNPRGMAVLAAALAEIKASRIRVAFRPDAESTGELVGTFILVFFGLGAVHVAVLTNGLVGLGQVAAVWGVAVGVAIYATAELSGAHLNPAITLALAVYRGFPWRKTAKYMLAQFVGAFLAAAALYVLFGGLIGRFEQEQGIVRGGLGSERSAMIYGEYFPNPGMLGGSDEAFASLSIFQAMAAEVVGTAMLALIVFAASQTRGSRRPATGTVAVCVGLGLAMLIAVLAPLTQAGFNPARDFGPRLFSYLAGWGNVAIPGPRGGFFIVYILGPLLGGLAGGGIHGFLAGLAPAESSTQRDNARAVLDLKPSLERNGRGTQLILVGGFLGSGKTTLLQHAAERLRNEGKQVGLVTNDQAANLVDTSLLKGSRAGEVREVAGGCFCCRFPDLVTALANLVTRHAPDTILCEPVGSCTDISATVLQPLKKLHGDRYRLTPYTVLLDPHRTVEALGGERHTTLPDHVLYIVRKQIEEADLLVINKADITPAEALERCRTLLEDLVPDTPVITMSALTGTGISEWLGRLEGLGGSGQRIADVDYDVYADGEAALGWLNTKVHLTSESPVNWHEFADRLLSLFRQELRRRRAEIAHLKFRLTTGQDTLTANLTGTAARPFIRGRLDTSQLAAQLLFNARVHIAPDQLEEILESSLAQITARYCITADVGELSAFAPARPQPTHRFPSVVH